MSPKMSFQSIKGNLNIDSDANERLKSQSKTHLRHKKKTEVRNIKEKSQSIFDNRLILSTKEELQHVGQ